jgi:hypothetical protein
MAGLAAVTAIAGILQLMYFVVELPVLNHAL